VPPLGEKEITYETGRVPLEPGDLLVVFTDGVIEAVNEANQEFGEARLVGELAVAPPETAPDTLKRVMAAVNAFVGASRQHDDITCLVLRVAG
jgi:sigma-B regulation protein RsbU (phosphoserine phosphatase)